MLHVLWNGDQWAHRNIIYSAVYRAQLTLYGHVTHEINRHTSECDEVEAIKSTQLCNT